MVISSGGAGLKGKRLNSTNDNTPVLEIFSIRSKYFQSISNVPIASIGRTYLPFFVSTSTFCSFSCRLGNVFTTRPWSHFDLSLLPCIIITRSPIWTFFDPWIHLFLVLKVGRYSRYHLSQHYCTTEYTCRHHCLGIVVVGHTGWQVCRGTPDEFRVRTSKSVCCLPVIQLPSVPSECNQTRLHLQKVGSLWVIVWLTSPSFPRLQPYVRIQVGWNFIESLFVWDSLRSAGDSSSPTRA